MIIIAELQAFALTHWQNVFEVNRDSVIFLV